MIRPGYGGKSGVQIVRPSQLQQRRQEYQQTDQAACWWREKLAKRQQKEQVQAPKYEPLVVQLHREFPEMEFERIKIALDHFNRLDTDRNGTLDKQEFAVLLRELLPTSFASGPLFDRLVDLNFEKIDTDRNGKLDKREFIKAYNDLFANERRQIALLLSKDFPSLTLEQLELALATLEELDKNGDSEISMEELYQLKDEATPHLRSIFQRVNIEQAFASADTNHNGTIDYSEFLNAVNDIFGSGSSSSPSSSAGPSSAAPAPAPTARPAVQKPAQAQAPAPSGSARAPDAVFADFRSAESLPLIVRLFKELKRACGIPEEQTGIAVYETIKGYINSPHAVILWKLIDGMRQRAEYQKLRNGPAVRVLITGAGPGGLRSAVESLLLGADVTILEKRPEFSRNNLLHIWDSSIRDLTNVGAKFFHPKFCIGGIHHIAIRSLQSLLLKISLVLGAKFLPGVEFVRLQRLGQPAKIRGTDFSWKAEVGRAQASDDTRDVLDYQLDDNDLVCNVLIGADGENSQVAREFGFDRKVLQGSRAIGITANFVNGNTSDEKKIREFGLLAVYSQQFFGELNEKYGIDLENLVYYRGETHYFVMTAKTQSLIQKGVVKAEQSPLITPDNVNASKLEEFVREVADYVKLPATCRFAQNHRHKPDVAIFDFSKKQMALKPVLLLGDPGKQVLVALVGDALVEPFWPLGTGANRAILASLDTAWMIRGFFAREQPVEKLEKEWMADYKVMCNSSPEDLVKNFGLHTIDPASRYKKHSVSHFH